MRFEFINKEGFETSNIEICHHYDSIAGTSINSKGNKFFIKCFGCEFQFEVPLGIKFWVPLKFRLLRRLMRLDKSNAFFNHQNDGVVIVYRGHIYFFEIASRSLKKVCSLKNCRNVLHASIYVGTHQILLGEYGANKRRNKVPIWASTNDGRNWDIVYSFPENTIKHIHGIYEDPYTNSLWIPTGDFEGECFVFELKNNSFSKLKKHGDGSQIWRPVSMFFTEASVIWGMDSQLEVSKLQVFDRFTEQLKEGASFPGPVWYSKVFTDGGAVLATTVEPGPGCKSSYAQIFFSKNFIDWTEVARFKKDKWPMRLFKFGVIAFATGPQAKSNFVIFGEGLVGLDGTVEHVSLVNEKQ